MVGEYSRRGAHLDDFQQQQQDADCNQNVGSASPAIVPDTSASLISASRLHARHQEGDDVKIASGIRSSGKPIIGEAFSKGKPETFRLKHMLRWKPSPHSLAEFRQALTGCSELDPVHRIPYIKASPMIGFPLL